MCVVNLYILTVLEYIFRVTLQSVDINIPAIHKRIGSVM